MQQMLCRQKNQCSRGHICALCLLYPCAGFIHNPIHNTSALLPFLPNPPPPCSARISSCLPAGAMAGSELPGGLLSTRLGHPGVTTSSPVGRVRRVEQEEGDINCSLLGKYGYITPCEWNPGSPKDMPIAGPMTGWGILTYADCLFVCSTCCPRRPLKHFGNQPLTSGCGSPMR